VPTQKDTKRETVLMLTFVKSYQVSNRKCNETTFCKNCTKSCLGNSGPPAKGFTVARGSIQENLQSSNLKFPPAHHSKRSCWG